MSITCLGSGEFHSKAVVSGDTVYLCNLTNTDRTQDVFRKTQDVIEKTGYRLLKSGHEKSKIIPLTSYMMDIILNPAMNEKWCDWLGSLARPNRICIGNFNTEKDARAQNSVTATE